MIGFFNTNWEPITQSPAGVVYVARLMLSASSRTPTIQGGTLLSPQPFPKGNPVYGEYARQNGRLLLEGAWNPSGYFDLYPIYALHDWYYILATQQGTLSITVGGQNASINITSSQSGGGSGSPPPPEPNRVAVLFREVGKTHQQPIILLHLKFDGNTNQPFKLYPEDIGTYNIEWIDIEPVAGLKFHADVGELTANRPGVPLEITVTGYSGLLDVNTVAVVFTSTM